ncbi:MAG TPA: L-dopachrome tautomerase-related protein [Lamprocystis sp. (in: g-proteobacteria)]|nr:L-dopachrome tautomerase-related protein [Lamprocystis sp. (in: g-proteobacteria)]
MQQDAAPTLPEPPIPCEVLYRWSRLDWQFEHPEDRADFLAHEYWRGALPAGVKFDRDGTCYVSVPRWSPGIPATVNRIEVVDGRPLLVPYPSPAMNRVGAPEALQSVLGWEIDEHNRAWLLDQGHVVGAPNGLGDQKLVCWDITANRLVESIPIPHAVAAFNASFLNDLAVDNHHGVVYIADSGIFTDPLQGGLIVFDMNTRSLRRLLHQHPSTQDEPGFRFEIAGRPVRRDQPMRTGADGIALSADRQTLYWCPLTGRHLYAIDTALLRDPDVSEAEIAAGVRDLGEKRGPAGGTNSDGLGADALGNLWYTMLEGRGVGVYRPRQGTFTPLLHDPRMCWVDGLTFDNGGYIVFNSNRLHQMVDGDMDWDDPDNFIVWRAFLGASSQSYLYWPGAAITDASINANPQ